MATSANQVSGVVSSLKGNAWVVGADGLRRALQPGDTVEAGQKVITEDGSTLELSLPNGQTIAVASGRELAIEATMLGTAPVDATEAALQALNAGTADIAKVIAEGGDLSDALDATAAGLTGGDASDSHSFVRILRIEEQLSPLSIDRNANTTGTDIFTTNANGVDFVPTNNSTPAPSAAGVSNATVGEGGNLTYTVTLSNAGGVATAFTFGIAGSGAHPISPSDIGTPTFSNGVTYDPITQTITVPAGVSSFSVTIPVVADTIAEPTETLTLTVGDLIATGTITDKNAAPTVQSVSGDTQAEGGNLVHTVTLTNASSTETTLAFNISGGAVNPATIGTAAGGDTGAVTFSNGVVLNSDGTITVPAGVTSFTVTIATTQDPVHEANETLSLTVGGVSVVSTITDNDAVPTVQSVTSETKLEGADLVHTVTLTNASSTDTNFVFNLAGGSVNPATIGSGAGGDTGLVTFSNGVILNSDGTITVPAGVTSFTVTVATTPDSVHEANETLNLTVGGVTATSTITDNDAVPTVQSVTSDTKLEGADLVHTVTLTNASSTDTNFVFNLAGGSVNPATIGTGVGGDTGAVSFSNGVILNSDGTITVPAGVTSFTVTVATTQDTVYEANETLNLNVGAVTATSTITDNDAVPTVQSVTSDTKLEGADLVHTVTLTNASSTDTNLEFNLTGGSVNPATIGTGVGGDTGAVSFSKGVILNSDGTITVPAGVTSFTVTVATTQDTVYEANETLNLTVGAVTATSTITNDDAAPVVTAVSANTVAEGGANTFDIALSTVSSTGTVLNLSFAGGAALGQATLASDTVAGYKVSFDGGQTYSATLTGNSVVVPAGTTAVKVQVLTAEDSTYEGSETYTLTATANGVGQTATATIDDSADLPTISSVTGDTVVEGLANTFTVNLSNPSVFATTVSLALSSGTGAGAAAPGTDTVAGYKVSFNGGPFTAVTGTDIVVPPNTSGFKVQVDTVNDTIFESTETYTLTATANGVSQAGQASITDNDVVPTVSTITPATVAEGGTLLHTVTLSGESSTPTLLSFGLVGSGGTQATIGTDTGTPVFSDNVSYDPVTGKISVPAGVLSFTVSIPTQQDTVYEGNETLTLAVGTKSALGTITDAADLPVVSSVTGDTALEGAPNTFSVNLSTTSTTTTSVTLALNGVSATVGTDTGTTYQVSFNGGPYVTLVGNTVSVPANTGSFNVRVATVDNSIYEGNESYTLTATANSVSASGTAIIDDSADLPKISSMTANTVTEGAANAFTVNLSNSSTTPTSVALSFAGSGNNPATIGTDTGTYRISYDNGTTWTALATLTNGTAAALVPAGKTSFLVQMNTVNDTVFETAETYTLTASVNNSSGSAVATITDNDTAPTVSTVSASTVAEGASLVHTVTLSNASSTASSFAFSIAGSGTSAALVGTDTGTPVFSNNVSYDPVTGKITVPAGVASFTVTVPTVQDNIYEPNETLTLSVGGKTALGTITNDDPTPKVSAVTGDTAAEGGSNTFDVALTNPSSTATTVTLAFSSSTGAGNATLGTDTVTGYKVSFDGGLTYSASSTAATVQVPAGATGFKVQVLTKDDAIFEGIEVYTLTATANGVAASGTATIDDSADLPKIATMTGDTVTEGAANTFNITLSNASTTATSVNLALAGSGTDAASVGTDTGTTYKVSYNGGSTWTTLAGSVATVPVGVTSFKVQVATTADTLLESTETYQLTASVNGSSNSATGSITNLLHTPVASADSGSLKANASLTVAADSGLLANDTVDTGNTKTVLSIGQGSSSAALTSGSATFNGKYGLLTVFADGHYTYAPNAAGLALPNGATATDTFTYAMGDSFNQSSSTTLTLNLTGTNTQNHVIVAGPAVVTDIPAGPGGVAGVASGLNGEYYGYNETATNASGMRTHADDGTALFGNYGAAGNLKSVENMYAIIDGRNGTGVVGSATSASAGVADVAFQARTIDYGFNPLVQSSLGSNSAAVAPGAHLLPADNLQNSSTQALSNFLFQDSGTGVAQTGALNTNNTSGLGTTTDAIVRLTGDLYVQPGQYDFRVTADDGFRLIVAGQTLLEFDGNQAPTTRVFTNVTLGNLEGGLQTLELLYWEQGGNARLRIEYKASSDPASAYQVLSTTNTPLFSHDTAPVLTDPSLQDLVYDASSGHWQLRTGAHIEVTTGNNDVTGTDGRDHLVAGSGIDTLHGGGGADTLAGGTGSGTLLGEAGNDLLIGGSGSYTLTGGAGDDVYRISNTATVINEAAGQGTDTIQLDTAYVTANAGTTYSIAAAGLSNIENLTAFNGGAINLTGNASSNHLEGNASANVIVGGTGSDYIAGGKGDDILTGDTAGLAKGSLGSDVFAWHLGDAGTTSAIATDTITDFYMGNGYSNVGTSAPAGGGDVLDLRDLLSGERTSLGDTSTNASTATIGNLLNYVRVEVSGSDTLLHISSNGQLPSSGSTFSNQDQVIKLQGVNLYTATSGFGVASGDEAGLLTTMLKRGTLVVD